MILISFLKAACDRLDNDLKMVIADDESFDEALFALGQFSLVKRETTNQGDSLLMHRLVKSFLQDQIDINISIEVEAKYQWSNVVALGYGACPILWAHTDTNRNLCRRFQNQLLPPLMECPRFNFGNILVLLEQIGWRLNDEGN